MIEREGQQELTAAQMQGVSSSVCMCMCVLRGYEGASALIQAPRVRGVGGCMQALGGVCMYAASHATHGRYCMLRAVTRTRPIVVPTHGQ